MIKLLLNDTVVEESELNQTPTTSRSETEAMLSKCIDWFEIQEAASATRVLFHRKIRNIAVQKARASKKQKKMTAYILYSKYCYLHRFVVANNKIRICYYKSVNICTLIVKFLLTVYVRLPVTVPVPTGDGQSSFYRIPKSITIDKIKKL